MIDLATYLQPIALVAIAIVGYFVRKIHEDLKQNDAATAALATALTDFKLDVAKNYVSNSDLQKIEDTLLRIEDRLNSVIARQ